MALVSDQAGEQETSGAFGVRLHPMDFERDRPCWGWPRNRYQDDVRPPSQAGRVRLQWELARSHAEAQGTPRTRQSMRLSNRSPSQILPIHTFHSNSNLLFFQAPRCRYFISCTSHSQSQARGMPVLLFNTTIYTHCCWLILRSLDLYNANWWLKTILLLSRTEYTTKRRMVVHRAAISPLPSTDTLSPE